MSNINFIIKRKAQSFLDYSALIAIVIFALIAMSGYVMKSVNARFAHVWADLYHVVNGVR
ncbi:MAG: hypothetical protein PHP17_05360 [Candidatus Omnitrophica bacterium]|nr:hypothetical protein [Candidatus Omnitrophota bacterium]